MFRATVEPNEIGTGPIIEEVVTTARRDATPGWVWLALGALIGFVTYRAGVRLPGIRYRT